MAVNWRKRPPNMPPVHRFTCPNCGRDSLAPESVRISRRAICPYCKFEFEWREVSKVKDKWFQQRVHDFSGEIISDSTGHVDNVNTAHSKKACVDLKVRLKYLEVLDLLDRAISKGVLEPADLIELILHDPLWFMNHITTKQYREFVSTLSKHEKYLTDANYAYWEQDGRKIRISNMEGDD